MGLRGGLFGIFFVHFLLMQRDGEQKIFFVNQQKRNLHEHSENGVETWENEKLVRRYCL